MDTRKKTDTGNSLIPLSRAGTGIGYIVMADVSLCTSLYLWNSSRVSTRCRGDLTGLPQVLAARIASQFTNKEGCGE